MEKNRYKNYQVKKLIWEIDKNGEEYKDVIKYFGKKEGKLLATIIYAHFKQKYILYVEWSSQGCLSKNHIVSRFELDCCERTSYEGLKKRLFKINPVRAQEFS